MPSTCKATHSLLKSFPTHTLQFGQFGDSAGVCDHMWLHVCVLVCMCMKDRVFVEGGGSKDLEGVKSRRAAGGGGGGGCSYLTGCKKMPPGLLMEETGISSETSTVPACH